MDDMNSEFEQAMDEARSDITLSDIDIGYIKECIDSQLENLQDTSSKKNYLKHLTERLSEENVDKEYADAICGDLYAEVIGRISEKLHFDVDTSEENLESMAKTFYKFFVINYSNNIVYFIESVITENQKQIINELQSRDNINTRHIEGINSKISMMLNNISDVIDIISGMDLTFEDYLYYINLHDDAKSSSVKMQHYLETSMSNTDEILPSILKGLLDENECFASIYTNLQINIYNRFNKE